MYCAPARPRSWTVTGRTRVNAQLTVRVTGGADMAACMGNAANLHITVCACTKADDTH